MKLLLVGQDQDLHHAAKLCSPEVSCRVSALHDAMLQVQNFQPGAVIILSPFLPRADWFSMLEDFLSNTPKSTAISYACKNPEQLLSVGGLILDRTNTSPRSLLHDIILPPVSEASMAEQIKCSGEFLLSYIKTNGSPPPHLCEDSWVHTLGDQQSKQLWFQLIPRYATFQYENPLIHGETGTGKTQVAKALHALSGRTGPFVTITPRDFSSSELVQAELFGSTAGAYTGAIDKWGLVNKAEKGTLFIDELQSIDLDLQGKLITFIENKIYRRIGSTETNSADVRFVFATNRDLRELVDEGILRDDFAWRLEGLKITLPKLSERVMDIPAACCHSFAKVNTERYSQQETHVTGFEESAYKLLCKYAWPGNLRQLSNSLASMIERATVSGSTLISESVVREVLSISDTTSIEKVLQAAIKKTASAIGSDPKPWDELTTSLNRQIRLSAIELSNGDLEKASQIIGEQVDKLEMLKRSNEA